MDGLAIHDAVLIATSVALSVGISSALHTLDRARRQRAYARRLAHIALSTRHVRRSGPG